MAAKAQPQFAGGETVLNSTVKETSRVMSSLFGNPGKNMLWSVGYGLGGLLLIPIVPIAVGAFCMAGVHLVSASYQFLHDKPDEAAEKAEIEKANSAKNDKQKSSTQKLSLNA
jgi:hypothetical protein